MSGTRGAKPDGSTNTGTIPGIAEALVPHATSFCAAVPLGTPLLKVIVDSGWVLSWVGPVQRLVAEDPDHRGPDIDGWCLRARPPLEIADSFDVHVEVLFYVAPYHDLQARTVEGLRRLVESDRRVSRDVVFLVIQDEDADRKIQQVPQSESIIPLVPSWINSAAGGGAGKKPLRVRLERFAFARDLFDERTPVVGHRFFGRQEALQRLRGSALRDAPVGLLGLRKIGKTSLLKVFKASCDSWDGDQPINLAVHMDLQAVPIEHKTWKFLLWEIGRQLNAAWRQHPAFALAKKFEPKLFGKGSLPDGLISYAFDTDLKGLVRAMRSVREDVHVVVILDEIELMLPPNDKHRGFEGGVDLVRYFRGLQQEGWPASFVIAGANPYFAEKASLAGQENPLLNFVSKEYLAPFKEDETRQMIARLANPMGLRFHHEASAVVYREAGGHPFLTRQLCSAVAKHVGPTRPYEIAPDDVVAVLGRFARSQFSTFEQVLGSLVFYPDELYLLRQLARGEQAFVAEWSRSDPMGLEHLLGYGLIQECGSSTSPELEFVIPLFRDYLLASANG